MKGGGSERGEGQGEPGGDSAGRGGKGVTTGQGERGIYRPASTPTRSHRLANRNGRNSASATSWWVAGQARRFHNFPLPVPAENEGSWAPLLWPKDTSGTRFYIPPSPHATFLAFPRTTSIRTPRRQQIGIKNSTPIQRGRPGIPARGGRGPLLP